MPRRRRVSGLRGLRRLLRERRGLVLTQRGASPSRIRAALLAALALGACESDRAPSEGTLSWTLAGANAARAAASPDSGPVRAPRVAWTSPVARGIVSEPVLARLGGDRVAVLVGSASEVRALDLASGAPIWSRAVHGAVNAAPALAGGFAWALTMEGEALRLDPENGAVLQSIEHDFMLDASPLVVGGTLVIEESALSSSESGGRVIALDAATGRVSWQVDVPRSAGRPAASDGELVFVARQDGVTALRLLDGGLAWTHESPRVVRVYSPVVAKGLVVVAGGSYDPAHLSALDAATGEPRWEVRAAARVSAAPALADDEILLPLMDGKIHRHALEDGRLLGVLDPGGRSDARPVVGASLLFVPTGSEIVAFDRATLAEAWRFRLEGADSSGAAIEHLVVAGTSLLVARLDGRLDALSAVPR